MNKLIYTTAAGDKVELTEGDMFRIHQHYQVQCTADYLRENHADWDELKVQMVAKEARNLMITCDYTEDEAIEAALADD